MTSWLGPFLFGSLMPSYVCKRLYCAHNTDAMMIDDSDDSNLITIFIIVVILSLLVTSAWNCWRNDQTTMSQPSPSPITIMVESLKSIIIIIITYYHHLFLWVVTIVKPPLTSHQSRNSWIQAPLPTSAAAGAHAHRLQYTLRSRWCASSDWRSAVPQGFRNISWIRFTILERMNRG